MSMVMDYKKEIINVMKELSNNRIKELVDFAEFLRAQESGFSYKQVNDSVDYIRKLRMQEGERIKSGEKFIREIIEWQKLES